MKEMFANADIGIIGLIIFFILFCCVVVWTLRPSARQNYKKYGEIPIREERNNDK